MNKTQLILLWAILCMVGTRLYAQTADPVEISRTAVNEVVQDMLQNEAVYTQDKARLDAMVERRLLPRFDFAIMTQLAVGQPWRQASPEQKATLIREFRTLLVRTYTNILFANIDKVYAYRDSNFVVDSSRTLDNGDVMVEVNMNSNTREPIRVSLRMRKKSDDWKVIDVSANGVSLVVTYRTTFAREASQSGLEGLIRTLTNKNRSNSGTLELPTNM